MRHEESVGYRSSKDYWRVGYERASRTRSEDKRDRPVIEESELGVCTENVGAVGNYVPCVRVGRPSTKAWDGRDKLGHQGELVECYVLAELIEVCHCHGEGDRRSGRGGWDSESIPLLLKALLGDVAGYDLVPREAVERDIQVAESASREVFILFPFWLCCASSHVALKFWSRA